MASEPARYRFGPIEPGGRDRRPRLEPDGLRRARPRRPGGLPERRAQHRRAPSRGSPSPDAGLASAFLRLGGRPPVAWAAIASGFAEPPRDRPPPPPLAGTRPRPRARLRSRTSTCRRASSGLRILSARASRGEIGIARDGSTWTAVLAVEGGAFALLELDDKERRLARWGAVLSGFARPGQPGQSPRLDRSHGHPARRRARALPARRPRPAAPPTRACAPTSSCSTTPARPARQHETFLALQIDARRASGAIRRAGGGEAGAAAVLVRELSALSEHLLRAEVVVRGALSPRLLARAIRLGFCPDDRPGLDRRGGRRPRARGSRSGQRRPDGGRGVLAPLPQPTTPSTPPTGSPSGRGSRSARTSSCRSCSAARRGARSRW